MADEEETTKSPLETARDRADALGLDGDEYDDYVEGRMRRAGFKKGPGDWISVDDDSDKNNEDDDEPMTRGDWRKIRREQKQNSVAPPPKKRSSDDGEDTKKKTSKRDPWW